MKPFLPMLPESGLVFVLALFHSLLFFEGVFFENVTVRPGAAGAAFFTVDLVSAFPPKLKKAVRTPCFHFDLYEPLAERVLKALLMEPLTCFPILFANTKQEVLSASFTPPCPSHVSCVIYGYHMKSKC